MQGEPVDVAKLSNTRRAVDDPIDATSRQSGDVICVCDIDRRDSPIAPHVHLIPRCVKGDAPRVVEACVRSHAVPQRIREITSSHSGHLVICRVDTPDELRREVRDVQDWICWPLVESDTPHTVKHGHRLNSISMTIRRLPRHKLHARGAVSRLEATNLVVRPKATRQVVCALPALGADGNKRNAVVQNPLGVYHGKVRLHHRYTGGLCRAHCRSRVSSVTRTCGRSERVGWGLGDCLLDQAHRIVVAVSDVDAGMPGERVVDCDPVRIVKQCLSS